MHAHAWCNSDCPLRLPGWDGVKEFPQGVLILYSKVCGHGFIIYMLVPICLSDCGFLY